MAKWREIPIGSIKSVTLENGDTLPAAEFFGARGPLASNVTGGAMEALVRDMLTRAVEEDCIRGKP